MTLTFDTYKYNLPKAAIPADLDFSLYYLQNDLQQILALTAMIIHQ